MADKMPPLSSPLEEMRSHYDVAVIGSGYGGGVAASRLSRMGQRVCVLERGREVRTGEFPQRFPELRRELQVTGGRMGLGDGVGLFDVRIGKDIHVITGCGLGGGSLINAAVALRPDRRVFEQERWPAALRDDWLEEGFMRAERMLRPRRCPEPQTYSKYRAFEKSCDDLDGDTEPAPIAINFTPSVNRANIAQQACTGCGDCCAGCNVGAKNTVALTYLPDARHFGAQMFTKIKVSHVKKTDQGWRTFFHPPQNAAGEHMETMKFIDTDKVIFAAGTLGTCEILLRSAQKGLALSPRLGKSFTANGDIIAFGYDTNEQINAVGVGHPPKVETAPVGPSVAGLIRQRDEQNLSRELIIEEGVLPSAMAPLLPVFFVPGGRLVGALKSLIQGVYSGSLARTQTFFAVSHDDAAGCITLEGDKVAISWPDIAKQPVYQRVDETIEKTVKRIGGSYVKNPLSETVMGRIPATAHPLGGCSMGECRETGVINHKCQLFDGTQNAEPGAVHDGLYVCDGSIMATSLGVNPLLTITALAERAMIILALDNGWSFDDHPIAKAQKTRDIA